MKKVSFIMFFLVFILNVYSQNEHDFGNYQWETTINIIRTNEGTPDREYIGEYGNHRLVYNNKILEGHIAEISYTFFRDRLVSVAYIFQGIYTLDNGIEIYIDLLNKLNNIYGKDQYYENRTDEQNSEQLRQNYENRGNDNSEILASCSWSYENKDIDGTHIGWTSIEIYFVYYNILQIFKINLSYLSPYYYQMLNEISGP